MKFKVLNGFSTAGLGHAVVVKEGANYTTYRAKPRVYLNWLGTLELIEKFNEEIGEYHHTNAAGQIIIKEPLN